VKKEEIEMEQFEIYWDDLTAKAQNEILDRMEGLGISYDSNWTFSGAGIIYAEDDE
jgi:hypothetical protein